MYKYQCYFTKKDLKKGLIKVMDKMYEPLIFALLTEKDIVDVDKIYESLYVSTSIQVYNPDNCINIFFNQTRTRTKLV